MSDFIVGLSQIMRTEVNSLNAVAQNSANLNTLGYKSVRSTASENIFSSVINNTLPNVTTKVRTTNGQINFTEQPLDFAIAGDGWFGVLQNDQLKLTRNGRFHLNQDRVLVTQNGDPVLGVNGLITLPSESVAVGSDGEIIPSTGEPIQLAIYNTKDTEVSSEGNGLYSSFEAVLTDKSVKIIQGAVEESNVDSAADMVQLMESTRHIESIQRAINTYNELLNTGINQLGK